MLCVVFGDVKSIGIIAVSSVVAGDGGQKELEVAAFGDSVFRLDALPVQQGPLAFLLLCNGVTVLLPSMTVVRRVRSLSS